MNHLRPKSRLRWGSYSRSNRAQPPPSISNVLEKVTEDQKAMSKLTAEQAQLLKSYIHAHVGHPISITDLAGQIQMARSAFISRFKASMGDSPHQYVMKVRIEQARELLTRSDLDLADISHACGFANHPHFSSVFKRFTGVSPLAYRRSLK